MVIKFNVQNICTPWLIHACSRPIGYLKCKSREIDIICHTCRTEKRLASVFEIFALKFQATEKINFLQYELPIHNNHPSCNTGVYVCRFSYNLAKTQKLLASLKRTIIIYTCIRIINDYVNMFLWFQKSVQLHEMKIDF